MTTQMCQNDVGRVKYARFLVEFDAKKGFIDMIIVQYRNKENVVKGLKTVNVDYVWKPGVCSQCNVFGHEFKKCTKGLE